MTKRFNFLESVLSKRQKIIIVSVLITIGFILTTQTNVVVFRKYYFILIFAVLSYILSLWAISPGINKTKAFVLLILPVFYCIGVPGFYFLFQTIRWLTRLPMAVFFGLSFYCLLLSQNVLNVASDRAIPLYRAASTSNFVYTIFTLILLESVVFSFNLPFYWNAVLTFLISFPLVLQNIWTVKIENINSRVLVYSTVLSFILSEVSIALSFWQASPLVVSLYLNWIFYGLLGISVELTKDRLNSRVVVEYITVGGILFFITFLATSFYN